MTRVRIEQDRPGCIGCFMCVDLDPGHWRVMGLKAELIGGDEDEEGRWSLVDEVDDLGRLVGAAETCPVAVINVENLETGGYLVKGF